jgi:hypothetical protein
VSTQYADLVVKFRLRAKDRLLRFSNPDNRALHAIENGNIREAYIMTEMIYLGSLERKLFAANPHEFLIKNVQVHDYATKATGVGKM